MFERNRIENVSRHGVPVRLELLDGQELHGNIAVPAGRNVHDVLNGTAAFIELETYEGERSYLARAALRSVRIMSLPKAVPPDALLRHGDGLDPYGILGVSTGTDWEAIRQRYLELAKTYHPDRYASVELPGEIADYLAAMARRVNTAFASLEAARISRVRKTDTLAPLYRPAGR